jgi:hypothetical protein
MGDIRHPDTTNPRQRRPAGACGWVGEDQMAERFLRKSIIIFSTIGVA